MTVLDDFLVVSGLDTGGFDDDGFEGAFGGESNPVHNDGRGMVTDCNQLVTVIVREGTQMGLHDIPRSLC